MDHFSRLGLLAAGRAIDDTDPQLFSNDRTGVIVATGFGALETTFAFLDSYIEKGDRLSSPTHFSNSVHNAPAAHIAISYGIQGPNLTVSQFDLSFISALMTARIWLAEKRVDTVLVGTCDAFCDVLSYCINAFYKEKKLKSYAFAESSVFFTVTRSEHQARYGYIDDISIGCGDKKTWQDDQDGLTIVSPSAVAPCHQGPGEIEQNKDRTALINPVSSPTDCGTSLSGAIDMGSPVHYIKQDADGRMGGFKFQMQ